MADESYQDNQSQVSGFSSLDRINALVASGRNNSDAGDIINISFGHGTEWKLIAEYKHKDVSYWVIFDNPVSFHAHDEREIYLYWSKRNEEGVQPAFAHEIESSPYLIELKRGVSAIMNEGRPLRHFLVGGLNYCIEVIAFDGPTVTQSKPSSA